MKTSAKAQGRAVPACAGQRTVLSEENYKYLQQEIYRESGIVLDDDKLYLMESRLMPVARSAKLGSLDGLCARLRTNACPELSRQVLEALATHETFFFRDAASFAALREQVLPELLDKHLPGQTLRIWSAAASSGQEAYSIAMLLHEMGLQNRSVEILGTDISEQILERAREGKYAPFEVNRGLPAMYLTRYFVRAGLEWRLRDEVRGMASFRRFDLRQPMEGLGQFDIIFCRNVLIYFDAETRSKVLHQLWTVLRPEGYLVLGGAETAFHPRERFERIAVAAAAVYRKR